MLLQSKAPTFTPSKYQEPILDHITSNLKAALPYIKRVNSEPTVNPSIAELELQNIQVKASAGSGKTTLLAEAFRLHYDMGFPLRSVQVLSFVKKNVEDITRKFKDIVLPEERPIIEKQISTFNSFGYNSLMRAYDKWNVLHKERQCDTNHIHVHDKYKYLAEQFVTERRYKTTLCTIPNLVKFVDKLREQVILRPTVQDIKGLARSFQIRNNIHKDEEWEQTLDIVTKILYKGIANANPYFTSSPTADFTDQCLVPFSLAQGSDKTEYFEHFRIALEDWRYGNTLLLVDEVQDINPILLEMVRYMSSPWSTTIIVGDNGQNIYKWRGSQSNGMDRLASQIGARSYSLPISYRMPKNHIAMIKAIHPEREIEHHHEQDGAILFFDKTETINGEPSYIQKLKPYLDSSLEKLVVSRKRSNIVLLALDLLQRGYVVNVKGMATTAKKYAKQVCGFYKKGDKLQYPTEAPESIFTWIETWMSRTTRAMEGRNAKKSEINEIKDWAVCLQTLFIGIGDDAGAELPKTFDEWEERINVLSTRKKKGVVSINTIHSAKGAEAPIVIFVDPSECPITWYKQSAEDREQEENALFVAISRTKLTDEPMSGTLILLTDGPMHLQDGWLAIAGNYGELDF